MTSVAALSSFLGSKPGCIVVALRIYVNLDSGTIVALMAVPRLLFGVGTVLDAYCFYPKV